jgi:hypothetical protein
MQRKHSTLTTITRIGLCAVFALGFVAQIRAAEDKKADPTGTWTWSVPGRNGGPDRKMTLKLKAEGEKVTGTMTAPGRGGQSSDTEIKDGKMKGDEVSFNIVREFNGNTMTSKYSGKVGADSIKGKMEFERNGETQSRDWEAKKEASMK